MEQLTEIVACPAPLLRYKALKKESQNKTFEFPIGRGGSLKFESVGCYIPERENGKPIVETKSTYTNPGLRKDYIGLGILTSEADAIRTAAELREHVVGTREIEGFLRGPMIRYAASHSTGHPTRTMRRLVDFVDCGAIPLIFQLYPSKRRETNKRQDSSYA